MKVINTNTLIVGSGISCDFFLKGINYKNKSKITVLTGQTERKKELFFDKKNLSFNISNEFGGLSKKWLGTSKIYNKKDKEFKNYLVKEAAKIQKMYLKNNKFNLRSFDSKKIPKNFIEINNIKSKQINIYNSLNLKDKKGNILSAKKHNRVKYLNYRMDNFSFKKNYFRCICYSKSNKIEIKSKYLILASGTIDTSIHLIKYLKLKKIYFRHQPYFYGFFLKKNINRLYQNLNYPILNYEFNSKIKISGSLGSFSKRVFNYMNENFKIPKFLFKKIKLYLFNNIIFFNSFLNSNNNELIIKKNNNKFYLISKKNKSEIKNLVNNSFKSLITIINNNLKRIFFYKIFVPNIGEDKHYFGIKFSRNKKLKINNNCQLVFNNKIYIIDQSVMNFDTSNFITFISICNSLRIGKFFNKYLK